MEYLCRLCLKTSFNNISQLTENSEILYKLRICCLLQINLHPALPMLICCACKKIIDAFSEFYHNVVENEKKLKNYLESGCENLDSLYKSITENNDIKFECENTWDKSDNIKEQTINIEGRVNLIKTDKHTLIENIKNEYSLEAYNNDINYSSDDEINLSVVKAMKSINKTNKKIKTKISKTRKKLHPDQIIDTEIKLEPIENDSRKPIFAYEMNWKCLMCSDNFDNRNMLLTHYKMEHGDQKNEPESINENILNFEINGDKYKCLKCEKMYDKKRFILRHVNTTHIEDRPYVCKVCGRTYKTASDILRHGRAHDHIKMLSCKYERCNYTTSYIGALRDHEKRHCDDYKYKCEKCGKGFQVKTWYEQHQNVHTGERPFACHICGRTFQMHRYLKTHISTVHPQVSEVKRHMCTVCGSSCDNRHALNIHLKTHGIAASFLCDTCGKSLSSVQHLRLHSRTHLGIKPYSCGTCEKSFVKKCNLQLHKRVHSGEKPFVCSYCGKAFSQKSTLLIHIRYHTGSRPYKCENCTKSFVCQGLLSTHQKGCP